MMLGAAPLCFTTYLWEARVLCWDVSWLGLVVKALARLVSGRTQVRLSGLLVGSV